MIAALTTSGLIVEILDTNPPGSAFVLNLGRENIDQHYVGGEGYKGCRSGYMPASAFQHVALLADDDICVKAYQFIQSCADQLAEEKSPELETMRSLENRAFAILRERIITNSLPRATVEVEIAPKAPRNSVIAVDPDVEVEHGTDLHTPALAVPGSGSALRR